MDGAGIDKQTQEAAWWNAWRRFDLSWEGLARREGHSDATLQDYWRNEAGRLIAEPGTARQWTRFHCPFVFEDGTPSPKSHWTAADWADLHSSLRTRLAMGSEAKPCLLTGAVLDGLFEAEAEVPDAEGFLWLRANWAYFRDGVDLSRNGLGLADFRAAWFGGKAVFEGARAVTAEFDGALYGERMGRTEVQVRAETTVEPVRVQPRLVEPELEAPKKDMAGRVVAAVVILGGLALALWFLIQNA
ncbi:hypothetical protein ABAC460_19320 [Asticcacaulis sp. AC460]|uniref:hypothetical protein n=1 Tax=Asticcacaulis sp. AC460 TaxID=1282360 RepID=UPI0003C408DF|nr:hypothetical protein [Asticcacaulis sp. AC460]ESQ87479.1 hypothetical protein ABAC460_19320 [Asticcacaulis sp. AC460]